MNNYREYVLRTWNKSLTKDETLMNACLGIAGESGEFCDQVKKVVFHKHPADLNKLMSELGDIYYYLEIVSNHFGFTEEQIKQRNIEKLQKRYPDGFDVDKSINRKE